MNGTGSRKPGSRPNRSRLTGRTNSLDQAVNAQALKALVETAPVEAGLIIKLVLLSKQRDARAILDTLTMTDLSRLGRVRDDICAILSGVAADRKDAAE
ncbi:MAG: hypothetical protein KDJ77_11685 [Rhodobiaceae bacterium]|nr:hypothetical protein [Rhodobiaceae bacterium]